MRTYLLVMLMLLVAGESFARQETGFLNRTLRLNGVEYRYVVYVPANWTKHQKWPVILFLHGAGERGSDGLAQTQVGIGGALRFHPERYPFIVVMPQCAKNQSWTQRDMQEQALAALERSIKEFKGDRERIYLSGLSMGGYGTWDIAAQQTKRFAALVVICGGLRVPPGARSMAATDALSHISTALAADAGVADPYVETARRIGATPVWIFHGDADPTVSVEESRKMNAALLAAGGNVRYTEYPGVGHNSWDKAFGEPELPTWLLAQKLK